MFGEGWAWSSSDQTTWERQANRLPFGIRPAPAFVFFDNKLWAYGGVMGNTAKNDVWFTTDGVRWINVSTRAGWSPRRDHRVVEFMGKLWLIGGNDGYDQNDIWFSNNGVDWRSAGPAPAWVPRGRPVITVFNDKLWMYGGGSGPIPRIDVWSSENGRDWIEVASRAAWTGRICAGGGAFDGRLWFFGGAVRDGAALRDVWSSVDGATWVKSPDPDWSPRCADQAFVFDGKFWLFGGRIPEPRGEGAPRGRRLVPGELALMATQAEMDFAYSLTDRLFRLSVGELQFQRRQVRRRLFPVARGRPAPEACVRPIIARRGPDSGSSTSVAGGRDAQLLPRSRRASPWVSRCRGASSGPA